MVALERMIPLIGAAAMVLFIGAGRSGRWQTVATGAP
jgi:hypothetical protein